ncbi:MULTISPECIES: hydrogenase nickel incorporation protein HypB [unclassified Synechocystis]|uniref:hydrogenase nickel incorporation protein HypB n=1 Tax=unclassified Synechocystis TaxID=2640012 RepID=UPI00042741AB|nr:MULTISPECIES: hydrogenase nickel incorporation protein HypB [unclassified Synechocystis]AIE73086.1 [NiFe] hydrogenase nickel incorporation-associated protein HypB [Synechocystis sp. PCC 6714]MCT0254387.1 hydrogenase nickel incorporation protein HypB [Synechocystis sp. CS-94]
MCQNCGCSAVGTVAHSHHHGDGNFTHSHDDHSHAGHHHHSHALESIPNNGLDQQTVTITPDRQSITIGQEILSKNDHLAARNRSYFQAKGLLVMNFLSSPGAGKTALIQKMVGDRQKDHPTAVIVGDLATDNDAQRLRSAGAITIQVTTGNICHLEAAMVAKAAQQLDLDNIEELIIENVGNLVCPAAYDLGEDLRVVLFSVTEGEDKPLKYPATFKSAQVILVTKQDIAEAVGFDEELAWQNLRQVAPQAKIFAISARTGAGLQPWYDYLHQFRLELPSPSAELALA